ncbi:MAG: 2Fe-2S iron-sulfur cluster binding domain-containing protein [Candidatus Absconditabacterales bacterium]
MTVTIKLQRPDGSLISSFAGEDNLSIAQIAKQNGIDFPISCSIGTCGICKCKIISGNQYVQIDKITLPMKSLERHEDGSFQEVFACVGGILSDAIKDKKHHEIILEKNM